ncbi:MAG: TrmH family RNA methyltransferase [Prolixibacteraceae bacterium]
METNSVIFFRSETYPDLPSKPIVAAWNMKNPENIGSLIRVLDNAGGTELFLLDDENRKRESQIRKTAGLSYDHVRVHRVSGDWFFQHLPEGYSVCAVETSTGSENIFQTELPQKVIFLMGSEIHGLPVSILEKCEQVVHIPMTGACKSMNISHALAVSLFEWLRKQLFS